MPPLLDTFPYPFFQPEAQQLLRKLSELFSNRPDAISISEDSGINITRINTEQSVYLLWRAILKEAANQGILRKLVQNVSANLHAASSVKPYFDGLLANNNQPLEPQPFNSNDGSPKFLHGNDEIDNKEALLFYDDLTLPVGQLPAVIKVLQRMIELSPSVCKLSVMVNGTDQVGTAFRIGKDMLLTNWHVVYRELDKVRASTVIAEFGFEYDSNGRPLEAIPISCDIESIVSNEADDWAVIRAETTMQDAWPIIKLSEAGLPVVGTSANIIQHPMGVRKRIGYARNQVNYVDDRVVHYLTDTQDGSSGAPVFNSMGELIALHHAGGRPQDKVGNAPVKKNEGIRIPRIIEALSKIGISIE